MVNKLIVEVTAWMLFNFPVGTEVWVIYRTKNNPLVFHRDEFTEESLKPFLKSKILLSCSRGVVVEVVNQTGYVKIEGKVNVE